MRRRVALVVILVLALGLVRELALHHRAAPPRPPSGVALRAMLGPARTLPGALLGINGEAITGPGVWSDPRFVAAVVALHPEAIRVFGGTPADYWNWRTGTYVRSRLVPSGYSVLRTHIHVPLTDWARIVRASGTTPVFDLNMFTDHLRSQLAMLRAARRLGMPIIDVELGNELYLPRYATRFRDGADYGRICTEWIAAIKHAFPGVQVAADAYSGRDTNSETVDERELNWNSEMLTTLRGEAALSLHTYFSSGLDRKASLASPRAADRMLASPARRWAAFVHFIRRLPRRLQVWVTEWNLFDTAAPVHGTWAQALAVVAYGLDLLSDPRVVQSDYETLVNSAPFGAIFGNTDGLHLDASSQFRAVVAHPPATPLFGLSAGGVAIRALLGALEGEVGAQTIRFRSAPVRGIGFAGRPGFRAVLVNLSRRPALVSVPKRLRGLPYTEQWARPITLVTGLGSVRARSGATAAKFELQPFSLLAIGGR